MGVLIKVVFVKIYKIQNVPLNFRHLFVFASPARSYSFTAVYCCWHLVIRSLIVSLLEFFSY